MYLAVAAFTTCLHPLAALLLCGIPATWGGVTLCATAWHCWCCLRVGVFAWALLGMAAIVGGLGLSESPGGGPPHVASAAATPPPRSDVVGDAAAGGAGGRAAVLT